MNTGLEQRVKKILAWILIITMLLAQEGTSQIVYAASEGAIEQKAVDTETVDSVDLEADMEDKAALVSKELTQLSIEDTIEIQNAPDNTLQYMINHATSGEVITLTTSYSENIVILDDKEVIIDLNGHHISPIKNNDDSDSESVALTVFGTVTIQDSTGGNGGITNDNNLSAARGVVIASQGSCVLKSGKISGFVTDGNGAGVQIQNNGYFHLEGGSIESNTSGNYGGGIFAYNGNNLRMSGGEIKSNTAVYGGGVAVSSFVDDKYALDHGGLKIVNNTAEKNGGGFYLAEAVSDFQIKDVEITGNKAVEGNGGGLYFAEPVVFTMTGGKIGGTNTVENKTEPDGNKAENGYGGGVYYPAGSKIVVSGGSINGNIAKRGGGIYVNSSTKANSQFFMNGGTISYNELKMNQAVEILYGAGVFMNSYSQFTLDGEAEIGYNKNASYGGGVAILSGNTNETHIKGGKIIYNVVEGIGNDYAYGGGMYIQSGGIFKMTGGLISGNKAGTVNGHGGGIWAGVSLSMEGGEISNNSASESGGGINGTLEMSGTALLKGNTCGSNGGGIYGTLIMNGGIISDNYSSNAGGGYCGYSVVMTDGLIENNTAKGSGGGVWTLGTGTFSGGKIIRNSAVNGGAIYKSQRDNLCSISGNIEIRENSASEYGGAIYLVEPVDKIEGNDNCLIIDGGTIVENTARYGGGLAASAGATFKITGGIIYDNNCLYEKAGSDIRVAAKGTKASPVFEIMPAKDMVHEEMSIVGFAWYDEGKGETITEKIFIDNNETVSSYRLLYNRGENPVAEFEYKDEKHQFSTVQNAIDAVKQIQTEGYQEEIRITMLENSIESILVPAGTKAVLNLNGKLLRGSGSSVVHVEKDAKLTVEDANNTGKITQGIGQSNVTGEWPSCGGGVYVRGTFILKGGNITSNVATYGGGVYVEATDEYIGTFRMEGGSVSGNQGSGVFVASYISKGNESGTFAKFEMAGGEIKNNAGNGVYVRNQGSYFSMSDGVISGNKAGNGGGVYLYYSKMKMSGGVIEKNNGTHGAGISGTYLAEIDMTGGVIRKNKATGNGGAIQLSHGRASFVMSGGVITENHAAGDGGGFYGVYNENVAFGSTCLITGNDAQIYNNNCNGYGNDLFIPYKSSFKVRIMTELDEYNSWHESSESVYYTEGIDYALERTSKEYYLTAGKKENDTADYAVKISDGVNESFYLTVQAAVNTASEGEVIYLLKDTSEYVIVNKKVTIDLNGYNFYTVYQNGFYIRGENAHLTIRNSRETGGYIQPSSEDAVGRAVFISDFGTFTLESGTITGFKGMENGGAVAGTTGVKINLEGGTITKNQADYGGAVWIDGTGQPRGIQLDVKDTKITDNTAGKQGGAIYISIYRTSATLEPNLITINGENEFSGNTAIDGGAIYLNGCGAQSDTSVLTIGKTLIQNNKASGQGGGIRVIQGLKSIVFNEGAVFKGNIAENSGGAVFITSSAEKGQLTTINGGEFAENQAYEQGGAFYIAGSVDVYDVWIHDNNEGTICNGGGMYLTTGTYRFFKGNISNNSAKYGGGLYIVGANGSFTLEEEVKIDDNMAYIGGGIYFYNGDYLTINGASVSHNMAYNGGAIATRSYNAKLVLNGAQINNNEAKFEGGAIFWQPGGRRSLTINEGTSISGNSAEIGGAIYGTKTEIIINGGKINNNLAATTGGAIHVLDTVCTMTAGEMAGNKAENGGAIYLQSNASLYNSSKYRVFFIMNGGTIKDNEVTNNGGAVYVCSYGGDQALAENGETTIRYAFEMNGGVLTNNKAGNLGGGVFVSSPIASVKYASGQFYDNVAGLGQDIYCAYTANSSDNNVLSVADPTNMFGESDARDVQGWYDENKENYLLANTDTNGDSEKDTIYYNPVYRAYPLTLWYTTDDNVARINGVLYNSVQEAVRAIERGDENTLTDTSDGKGPVIEMIKDSKENVVIPTGVKATLNLNGYTLRGNTTAISCSGELYIVDNHLDDAKAGGIGTISGHSSTNGGGVMVTSAGTVTMSSGQISECHAGGNSTSTIYGGAGVCVDYGTFILEGTASINNCKSRNGSAVYIKSGNSRFVMKGGVIENNTTVKSGTVYLNGGVFEVYNTNSSVPIIKNNKATDGAALYVNSGKAMLNGGRIEGNTAEAHGGGIYIYGGSLQLKDVEICSNQTSAALSYSDVQMGAGGGIFVYGGTVNIGSGVYIHNNTARRGAGIYQRLGEIKMSGGTITRNTADLGGGIAQYPNLKGKCTVANGRIYGNISSISASGNDIYSWYEGSGEYGKDVANIPSMTLLAAADMGLTQYNVWRDDTYEGSQRVGQSIGEGQMITGNVISSNNLQFTAAWHEIPIEEEKTSTMYVQSISLNMKTEVTEDTPSGMEDGIQDGSNYFDTECEPEEKTAAEMLADQADGFKEETSETYIYNGDVLNKISYTGSEYREGLYEQNQAVAWSPGNDSSNKNDIVRTYDSLIYSMIYTVQDSVNDTDSSKEYDENEENTTVRLWMKAEMPYSSEEAEFSPGTMEYYTIDEYQDGDKTIQSIQGYWEIEAKPGTIARSITVKVYAMKNGDTIKPKFSAWIGGNEENEQNPVSCESRIITVSAMPRYNVLVMENEELAYTGYFNMATNEEATAAEREAYKEAVANKTPLPENIVYGTMLGYGITLELYNDKPKGLMGIELPSDSLEFKMKLDGSLYFNTEQQIESEDGTSDVVSGSNDELLLEGKPLSWKPYVWAYKENMNTPTGTNFSNTNYAVNMNWNDEDDLEANTQYAYSGAPFNRGGGTTACYSGGSWYAEEIVTEDTETVHLKFKVSGYAFDETSAPTGTSDGKSCSAFSASYVKPFSAGYVQVLFPVDETEVKAALDEAGLKADEGYVEVNLRGIAYDLDVVSVSGQEPQSITDIIAEKEDEAVIKDWVSYFPDLVTDDGIEDYKKHAIREMRYGDNVLNYSAGMYIYGGPGEEIVKMNYFNNAANTVNIVTQSGEGSTPIGSVVNIVSKASYGCSPIDPSKVAMGDQDYSQFVTDQEFNYVTAMNILQKFDAEAYTPMDGTAVQNVIIKSGQANTFGDKTNPGFRISTSETATSWAPDVTQSYELTILYAAKPDGKNWDKELSAGGERDMDNHREEDLLYFATLEDLKNYFGGDGKCVAILYQIRNCCLRTGRYFIATCKMQMSEDFDHAGQTFCITNDVRCWTTYRPIYKLNHHNNTLNNILYSFNWNQISPPKDETKPENITVYGAQELGVVPEEYRMDLMKPDEYDDGYIKTEYSNGHKVENTHAMGWYAGNTLLLYTLESSINIRNTDIAQGSNSAKEYYNISDGERTAKFEVIPNLAISSEVLNFGLKPNGKQSTEVTITLDLPKHLNYDEGSMVIDYSATDCGYEEGDLVWDITVVKDASTGKTKIVLKTKVPDVERVLPRIDYTCTIGTPGASKEDDAKNGVPLTTVATISATYEETNRIACNTKTAKVSITPLRDAEDYIYKQVGTPLLELGEDLVYYLNYKNKSDKVEDTIELLDILPYNGDSRGNEYSGGYKVKEIQIIFEKTETAEAFEASGELAYAKGKVLPTSLSERSTLLNEADAGTGWNKLTYAKKETEDTKTILTYDLSAFSLIQTADAANAPAIYTELIKIAPKEMVQVKIVLSPQNNSTLIADGNQKVQQGEDIYWNNFFYRSGKESEAVLSNKVFIKVAERSIKGRVWMDQNQDGLYVKNTPDTPSTDETLRNVNVSLYVAADSDTRFQKVTGTDANGQPVTVWIPKEDSSIADKDLAFASKIINGVECIPAVDILGNPVASAETDKEGIYIFNCLAEGTYYVTFADDDGDYGVDESKEAPLVFERLSVTPNTYSDRNPAAVFESNKSDSVYTTADTPNSAAPLNHALITNGNAGIALPPLAQIQTGHYLTNFWDCGLYYINYAVTKEWLNMTQVPNQTGVVLHLNGTVGTGTDNEVTFTAPAAEYKMVQNADQVVLTAEGSSYLGNNQKPIVAIDDNSVTWTVKKLPLQAEGAGGIITYSFTEDGMIVDGKEVAVLNEYVSNTTITVDDETKETAFSSKNRKVTYQLQITKTNGNADFYRVLEGAVFELCTDEACTDVLRTVKTGKDGLGIFEFLDQGTYYLKEIISPVGYKLSKAVYQVVITENLENDVLDDPEFVIRQLTDSKTGDLLDPVIDITYKTQFRDESMTSDTFGHTVGYTICIDIANQANPMLPLVGGYGTNPYIMGGTFGILATAILLMYINKIRRKEDEASS